MNEREDLIASILASWDEPVERSEPGHYYITDIMAVAEGTAPAELASEIDAHCQECVTCRTQVESFRLQQEDSKDFADLPLTGSLLEFAAGPPVPKPDYEGQDLTGLSRSNRSADRELLVDRLRSWLPPLFPDLYLRKQQVEDFLATLPGRPALTANQRFRDVLPIWLAEFLGISAESLRIDDATVAGAAVLRAIRREEPNESELARQIREFVLANHPRSPEELERLPFPARIQADPFFLPFADSLFAEVRQNLREGRELFELTAA
jgi:hypothetical protein